jgi:hypothetical protein
MSASVSLCPTRNQLKFHNNNKLKERTNWNEVNQERTRSSDVYGSTCCFVTVDDEWVCDTFHLMAVCNIQHNPAHWTPSTQVSLVESASRRVPYQIYVNVNRSPR